MNKQIRIEIRWTYPTDATPGMRGWNLICPISYDGDADASPILEAALAVPEATERTICLDLGVSDQRPTVERVIEALGEEASRRSGEIEEVRLKRRARIDEHLERVRGEGEGNSYPQDRNVIDDITKPEAAEIKAWCAGRRAAEDERRRLYGREDVAERMTMLRAGKDSGGWLTYHATNKERVEEKKLLAEICAREEAEKTEKGRREGPPRLKNGPRSGAARD